jgi:copper chaperone CopZ
MTKEFTVRDISCGHCAQAITQEVKNVPGVQNVNVDVSTKRVSVETNERVTTDVLVNAINEAGYADITVLN